VADQNCIKGFVLKSEIAGMYRMSVRSMARFFIEHEASFLPLGYTRRSKLVSPKVVAKIIEIIGPPEVKFDI
jgi:hypothetical protein